MKRLLLLLAIVATALVIGACSSSDDAAVVPDNSIIVEPQDTHRAADGPGWNTIRAGVPSSKIVDVLLRPDHLLQARNGKGTPARVTNPSILSPGMGLQHRAMRVSKSPTPNTDIPELGLERGNWGFGGSGS